MLDLAKDVEFQDVVYTVKESGKCGCNAGWLGNIFDKPKSIEWREAAFIIRTKLRLPIVKLSVVRRLLCGVCQRKVKFNVFGESRQFYE